MKSLRNYLVGLILLLLALGVLLWFFPARWAKPWIEPQLHGWQLQQVHGSLWQGRSDQVLDRDGQALGKVRWRLSRRSMLGEPELQLDFVGPSLSFAGFARRLADQKIEARDVTMQVDLSHLELPVSVPLGQPRGMLNVAARHSVLQGGWPMELQLTAQWQPALVRTHDGDVMLGALALQAQSRNGIIQAQLHDSGEGPLAASGQLQLSPLGWRLDVTLFSRHTDPTLDRWLTQFGSPAADGRVHIQQHGGLASMLPAPGPEQDTKQP